MTHVASVFNDDGEFLIERRKRDEERNIRFSSGEVAANLKSILAVNRGNVIVTFSFREKISEQTYDSRVPNILAIIHIENHWCARVKEIQFPTTFVENITEKKEEEKKITIETFDIGRFLISKTSHDLNFEKSI